MQSADNGWPSGRLLLVDITCEVFCTSLNSDTTKGLKYNL